MTKKRKQYWISEGYSDTEAIRLAKNERDLYNPLNKKYWEVRNMGPLYDSAVKLLKKYSINDVCFWDLLGVDGKTMVEYVKLQKNCYSPEYWKIHGFSESESDILSAEQRKEKCSLSKNYILKNKGISEYFRVKHTDFRKENNKYNTVEYFTSRGLSNGAAREKIKKNVRRASKRCIDYWTNRGHSIESAKYQISNYQNFCSLSAFQERYGENYGMEKYNEYALYKKLKSKRCIDYWKLRGFNDKHAGLFRKKYQSEQAQKQKSCVVYWVNQGFDLNSAKLKARSHARFNSCFCVDFWISRGYSYDDAIKNVRSIQQQNSMNSIKKQGCTKKSKTEMEIFEILSNLYLLTHSHKLFIIDDTLHYVDFYIPEIDTIVEYYGDYWHMNPRKYSDGDLMCGIPFNEILKRDKDREERLKTAANKFVVIWESDLNDKSIEEIIKEKIYEN